jgi:hypothetical protein
MPRHIPAVPRQRLGSAASVPRTAAAVPRSAASNTRSATSPYIAGTNDS